MIQESVYKKLFLSLLSNDIGIIAQTAYEIIGHPLSLVDVDYNVLSLLPNKKINDSLWDSMYEHQIVNYEMVLQLNTGKYQKGLDEHKDILFIDYGIGKEIPRIAATCKSNGVILGFLCVLYPDKDYSEDDFNIIKIISQSISIYLANNGNSVIPQKLSDHRIFMKNLFEENINTQEKLDRWLSQTQINSKPSYIVLSTKVIPGSNDIVYLKQLRNILNNHSNNTYACVLDNNLFILCTNVKTLDSKTYVHSIPNYFDIIHNFGFSIGISNKFDNLLKLPAYKYQASRSFDLNNHDEPSKYFYEDYIVSDIFAYAKEGMSSHQYFNPILSSLKKYDQKNNSEYFSTLKTYLLCFCDSNETTKQLNIHRNTLLYRLKKIEEITGYQLKHKQLCIRLLCDIFMGTVQ